MTNTPNAMVTTKGTGVTPADIRAWRCDDPKSRERDFADQHGIAEAQLLAACCGTNSGISESTGATMIRCELDTLMKIAEGLGEVMALTRNESCVHEKVGRYGNYRSGSRAAMIFNKQIDLRMFPDYWCHAFMVEKEVESETRRSIQVFDAAGDAVHKIFLREESDLDVWHRARNTLCLDVPKDILEVAERKPAEPAKYAPENIELLREKWSNMTDTHQFMRFSSQLGMNRLGAYRSVGSPFTRRLDPEAMNTALVKASELGIQIMVFTGNRGCIQIHSGPVHKIYPVKPWQNVLDPGFHLHLRLDHIAEVWSATKPSKKGPVVSVEAFDESGMLIAMMFGTGPEWDVNDRPRWDAMVKQLSSFQEQA